MKNTAVIGIQWGDEGKGKMSHLLSKNYDIVARFAGGNNAGHTVYHNGKKVKLHHIPSGIFFKDKISVMGSGMVVNLRMLMEEIEEVKEAGADEKNLRIAENAHVIFPHHRLADSRKEDIRKSEMLGTTKRGIGPAYTDKVSRCGVRMGDLRYPDLFSHKLKRQLEGWIGMLADEKYEMEKVQKEYLDIAEKIKDLVIDTSLFLHEEMEKGKKVMFEGAQAVMLDIDWGTYPYVTSSSCVAAGAAPGLGIDHRKIEHVLGISKAYTTRIGTGPFPTEDKGDVGKHMLIVGAEYGATTGRPRRCGWLDLVMLKYSCRVSGVDSISLMKLDVLSGIDPLKVCTRYVLEGKTTENFPLMEAAQEACEPLYEELPGWKEDITGVTEFEDLPQNAKAYVEFIENNIGVSVDLISVGPNPEQTIFRDKSWK